MRVTVMETRGKFDPVDLIADSDFLRTFALDIDWQDPGCELGALSGRVLFRVTSENLEYTCEDDSMRFVDASSPLESLLDAGVEAGDDADASGQDAAQSGAE